MFPSITDTISSTVPGIYGAGTNHTYVAATPDKARTVKTTPDLRSESTAEIAMTLMLMVARNSGHGERGVRSDQQLSGKTLGIVGFGRVGREVARRAHLGFGMKIVVHDRSVIADDILTQVDAEQVADIDHLLALSELVSLHCPADAETRHLIDALRLNKMKPDACLINTAGSELLDEEALADALWYDTIAGAGLYVSDKQPSVSDRLLACDNAVLLPCMTSASAGRR